MTEEGTEGHTDRGKKRNSPEQDEGIGGGGKVAVAPSVSAPSGTSSKQGDPLEDEHKVTSKDFVPRFTGPSESEMTSRQKNIRDAILRSRPRTGLSGPFGPWLAIPEIAEPSQELGRVCRYNTSLSFVESELVILLTGAKQKSSTEFDIHVREAIKAGVAMEVINAIPRDDQFCLEAVLEMVVPLLEDDRQKSIVEFTSELLDNCTVCDETYNETKSKLGGKDSTLVEIVSIVGYYTYVAYTLNVFQIPS